MAQNVFAAGPATVLMFKGQNFIGMAKALTDSSIEATITPEEIRGGGGNLLWGKYFHTSNMNITLTNPLFQLDQLAMTLGSTVASGGKAFAEHSAVVNAGGDTVTLNHAPVIFCSSAIAWYKLPASSEWSIGAATGTTLTVAGVVAGDNVCVKYFYEDPNATSFVANAQYVPDIIHAVLLIDLFRGSAAGGNCEVNATTTKAGRFIVDIPQLQFDGNQNLALTSTTAATVSLTGSALAVEDGVSCESEPFYGTFTQQLFNTVWQEEVTALAVVNGDMELTVGDSEKLQVKALRNGTAPFIVGSDDLDYVVVSGTGNVTLTEDGLVTGAVAGEAVVEIRLAEGLSTLSPAFAYITVS